MRPSRVDQLAVVRIGGLTFGVTETSEVTHPNAAAFPAGLSGPALRALATAGIRSLRGLTRWTERDVARLHGMGPKGIRILKQALTTEGLQFSADRPGGTTTR